MVSRSREVQKYLMRYKLAFLRRSQFSIHDQNYGKSRLTSRIGLYTSKYLVVQITCNGTSVTQIKGMQKVSFTFVTGSWEIMNYLVMEMGYRRRSGRLTLLGRVMNLITLAQLIWNDWDDTGTCVECTKERQSKFIMWNNERRVKTAVKQRSTKEARIRLSAAEGIAMWV